MPTPLCLDDAPLGLLLFAPSARSRSFRWASVLAFVFAFLAGPAAAQEVPLPDRLEGLDAEIQQVMDDWRVPGLAIAVVTDSTVVWSRGFGERNVGSGAPVTDRTLFAIGSTTKGNSTGKRRCRSTCGSSPASMRSRGKRSLCASGATTRSPFPASRPTRWSLRRKTASR